MYIKNTLVIAFACLCFITFYPQETSILQEYDSITNEGDFSARQGEAILDSLLLVNQQQINPQELAEIYYDLLKGYGKRNLDDAIRCALKIKEIGDGNNLSKEHFFLKNENNLVMFYSWQGDYHQVIAKGDLYINKFPEENALLAKLHRLLGVSHRYLGDFEQSINHLRKSIYISKQIESSREAKKSCLNLLRTYVDYGEPEYFNDALKLIENLDSISKIGGLETKDQLAIKVNEGVLYDLMHNSDKAVLTHKKTLILSEELNDTTFIFKSLVNLGNVHNQIQDFKSAEQYLNRAANFIQNDMVRASSVHNNLGDFHFNQSRFDLAIQEYSTAIDQLLKTSMAKTDHIPSIEEVQFTSDKVRLIGYLLDLGNAKLKSYEQNENLNVIHSAIQTYELADQLIDLTRLESTEELSKLFWRSVSADLYSNAVSASLLADKNDKAFYFIEKNCALLLLENITNTNAMKLANIPTDLLRKEWQIRSVITDLEVEFSNLNQEMGPDSLRDLLFKQKEVHRSFIDSLEIAYPKYKKLKQDIEIVTYEDVQSRLSDNQLILQYLISAENAFVCYVSKNEHKVYRIKSIDQLFQLMQDYRQLLQSPFIDKTALDKFHQVSSSLRKLLIPFDQTDILNKLSNITIIPDYHLQTIPFEPLIFDHGNDNIDDSYLINFADVSYDYSLSLSKARSEAIREINREFTAFIPSKFQDQRLTELSSSEVEINSLKSLFKGNIISNENASKDQFINQLSGSNILHISSHAGYENGMSWLAMFDENVLLNELVSHNVNSNLVVLSACKTSQGLEKKGEGIYSLARGFFNAGAGSVISTLQSVNETSNLEITNSFYNYLKQGNTNSKSLQLAKLDYLKNNQNTSKASPYYWSSVVLIGDTEAITTSKSFWNWPLIILTSIVILVLAFFLTRKKTAQLKIELFH